MLLHLKSKGCTQKTEYAVTVLMISLTWGPKINPQDNGYTTKEYEHHQAGPHGPQERIVGTQAGRHVQISPTTVQRYIGMAKADPLGLDALLLLEDPELNHRFNGGQPRLLRRTL